MTNKTITPSATWAPLDIDSKCKLWATTKSGTAVRQGNQVAAVRALTSTLNHLLAQSVRVIFQQGGIYATRAQASLDPLYQWWELDTVENEYDHHYRIVAAHRADGSGAATAQREDDATVITPSFPVVANVGTFPQDLFHTEMSRYRGAKAAFDIEGVTTNNSFSVVDICVYSKPLVALDISIHDYCPNAPSPGTYCVANIMEAIRSTFEELRINCLPVLFSWHSQGIATTPSETSPNGIVIDSTTDVNILKQTFTTRSADSPGFLFDCYKCAAGVDNRVPVNVSFLAAKADGETPDYAELTVEGPAHVASNTATDSRITGATATWYTMETNVYGNPAVDVTDTTTSRNKIDVFAHVASGDLLYLYAIRGRMVWAI